MSGLISKVDNKSTQLYVTATLLLSALVSTSAFAAEDSFSQYKKANGGDKSLLSQDGTGAVETSVKGFVNIVKWLGLLIGIVTVLGGLLTVKRASQQNSQEKPWGGWMAVLIGGLMTIVSTIAVIVGRSAENLAGVQ